MYEALLYSLLGDSDIIVVVVDPNTHGEAVAVNVILGISRSMQWEAILYKALLYSLFDGSGIVVVANVILGILRSVL